MKNPVHAKLGGFTLIELLVVVLIIGILSAIALPQYQRAVYKARAVEQLVNIRALKDSLDRFYMENGTDVAPTLDSLDIRLPATSEHFDVWVSKNNDGIYAGVSPNTTEDNRFAIRYFFTCRYPEYNRRIICVSDGGAGKKICQDLGGTGEHNYKFISSQKAYYLD